MNARTKAVELADMSHPAYRRFKEVIEPWGLRKKEHALHFRKVGSRPSLHGSAEDWKSRSSGLSYCQSYAFTQPEPESCRSLTQLSWNWRTFSTTSAGCHCKSATQGAMRGNPGTECAEMCWCRASRSGHCWGSTAACGTPRRPPRSLRRTTAVPFTIPSAWGPSSATRCPSWATPARQPLWTITVVGPSCTPAHCASAGHTTAAREARNMVLMLPAVYVKTYTDFHHKTGLVISTPALWPGGGLLQRYRCHAGLDAQVHACPACSA